MEAAKERGASIGEDAKNEFRTVTIVDTGESFRCRTHENLLESMRRLGKRGIPVGCRSGGCSVCKVEILSGSYRLIRPMSREYVSDEDLAAGRVLACCVAPLQDVTLKVIGKLRKTIMRECPDAKIQAK